VLNFLTSLSFTKKYIFALSLIAFFSILAFITLTKIINSQANDADVINLSGKQRMLSQRSALFAVNSKMNELSQSIHLMEKIHNKLLLLNMSENIKSVYYSKPIMLDTKVKKYIYSAKHFLNTQDEKSLRYMLQNSEELLKNLDYVVAIYQEDAEQKIKNLNKIELYLLSLILFTLVGEGIFIFRPIDKSVKRKTKEILNEKEYSDMITQINTNAIIVVNEKFEILTFNKSAEEIFGYSAKNMLFTKLNDDKIIPSKYLPQHKEGLSNFMKSGQLKNKDSGFELEGKHKDGRLFPIRISFGVKIEKNRKVVVANIQDITKEKEKDSIIIQQSRFAAMGEMIGNIAHQWRQPLSSISTISTGTKLRYKNNLICDEELEDAFNKINVHTQHLSSTIDDFREFFSEDRKKEYFSIDEVIEKSISLIDAMYMDNKITLNVKITNKELMLNGSSGELSQVFLNILNNAKDIFLEKDVENKIVLIRVSKNDNMAVICIKDNAGGVPDDIKLKIFEPYFTTKHKSQGTGIGLFMSRKIIEQHYNGTLQCTNDGFDFDEEKYFGASFNIRIPLA